MSAHVCLWSAWSNAPNKLNYTSKRQIKDCWMIDSYKFASPFVFLDNSFITISKSSYKNLFEIKTVNYLITLNNVTMKRACNKCYEVIKNRANIFSSSYETTVTHNLGRQFFRCMVGIVIFLILRHILRQRTPGVPVLPRFK